jgi:hypothetical protein
LSWWTLDRDTAMIALWNAGSSAANIAARIKAPSRNAVIGRISRLGAKGDKRVTRIPGSVPRQARRTPPPSDRRMPSLAPISRASTTGNGGGIVYAVESRRRQAAYPELPAPPLSEPTSANNVTLMERTAFQCGWVVGDTAGPETLMCGAPKDIEATYCPYHSGRAVSRSPNIGRERPDVAARWKKRSRGLADEAGERA